MRLFVLALVSSLAALVLTAATSSKVAAAPMTNAIVGNISVQPGSTWTDPETHLTYRSYTVTVTFTHRGPISVQVDEHAAPSPGERLNWDSNSVVGSGTDTLSFTLGSGLVGQPVYFEGWLFKPATYSGGPQPHEVKPEVIYDSRASGTYNN